MIATTADIIGHAEIPVIRMKNKSSAMDSRLLSAPKNSLLNLWKAGAFFVGTTAEELDLASTVAWKE